MKKKIKRKVLETKTDSSNERVWVVVCEVRATAYLFQTSLCSASHVTLSAFAAERRAAIDQYLPPAGRSAANPQQRREAGERWDGQTQTDRQTDRQTDAGPLHRPCSAYWAGSVSNLSFI